MGYLDSRYDGVKKVELGGGWWVEIKKCLSVAESEKAEAALVAVEMEDQGEGKPSKAKVKPDMVVNTREMVVASIVDWNLTDERDELLGLHPEAVLRQSVAKMPQDDYDKIAAAVREANAERSREDEARFPSDGSGSAEDGGDGEPDDREVLPGSVDVDAVGATSGPPSAG